MNETMNFDNITFPIIKKLNSKLLASDIISERPKTIEEIANGRKIFPAKHEFNNFNSYNDIKKYIKDYIIKNNINKEYLICDKSILFPLLNNDAEIYYSSIETISIGWQEPRENIFDDIFNGCEIVSLNPDEWDIEKVKEMVNNIKKK